jgi:DNA repair exonuclease SbcCD ATPase subunit
MKFNFPKIEQMIIRNFSLYTKEETIIEINENINNGVYCLAGANGLGKTTFLNIINFGLTGLVLSPNSSFFSPDQIQKRNSRFTDNYFNGRIKEKHKQEAEVELLLRVNDRYYKICRGFFERDSLRTLDIFWTKNKKKIKSVKTDGFSPRELNEIYKAEIAKDMGIDNFDYYVFIQLYVLTFDESRRLIFWDDRASLNTLSISFNTKLDDAKKLIDTERRVEKYDSDGRNYRWQATQIKKKIDNITSADENKRGKKEAEYLEICAEIDEIERTLADQQLTQDNYLKNRNYLYSEIHELHSKRKEYFTQYSEPSSKLFNNNEIIEDAIDEEKCPICGAKGKHIVDSIYLNIHQGKCPLCNTRIDADNVTKNSLLKKIEINDEEIANKENELDEMMEKIEGQERQIKKTERELKKIQNKKASIERDYPGIILENSDGGLKELYKQFEYYDKNSIESYKRRDELTLILNKLQGKIEKFYAEAETEFVPIVKRLAQSFIGYDLNISLQKHNGNLKFVIELKDEMRPESWQISESQRFFLDIALRMAIIIYLSNKGEEATMFIDTPEGSLDIAYESRVGLMFSIYVKEYRQNILMTANINASEMLVCLARECKGKKMVVRKMTEWTDLSIVQKEGEKLFKKVFTNIDRMLEEDRK